MSPRHDSLGDTRGSGLLWALEIVEGKQTNVAVSNIQFIGYLLVFLGSHPCKRDYVWTERKTGKYQSLQGITKILISISSVHPITKNKKYMKHLVYCSLGFVEKNTVS